MNATPSSSTRNRRKILAVLAGGLVLGVGAAITLAAWNDSEFATGTFTAGSFNMQGSGDGTTYADHATSPGLGLTFSANFGNLSPGDVVYAPYWVQLTGTTTANATVTPSLDSSSGANAPNISYKVYTVGAATTCDATGVQSGTVILTGTTLSTGTGATTFPLSKGTAGNPGTPQKLCFVVTAGSQAVLQQGATATAVWKFTATSN
ncbi:SipW-dependent-type signal peptide-containing protein [uncultured Microbacterium sp.]|uniref:SipW-dependent-type signal peptide-containing protein n=1 Tax=uncultured Microbacterium sp. TaxID=191216 RepID=UPI0025F7954F|nr:SipW-dependent-type signal peptide-containing protein [uncultured Microbacterium sp.]